SEGERHDRIEGIPLRKRPLAGDAEPDDQRQVAERTDRDRTPDVRHVAEQHECSFPVSMAAEHRNIPRLSTAQCTTNAGAVSYRSAPGARSANCADAVACLVAAPACVTSWNSTTLCGYGISTPALSSARLMAVAAASLTRRTLACSDPVQK